MKLKNEKLAIILAGLAIGVIAVLLVLFGNPTNMGFCIACFLRDTAGGLKLHTAAVVQYVRPEIIGLVLGSFLMACKATGSAGRVITMGFSVAPDEINQFVITSKELDVRGSRLQNRKFQQVIDLVNEGKVDLKGSISHTFPFEEAQKAFDFVDSKDPSIRKVVLTFGK